MISIAIPYHGDRLKWVSKTVQNVHDIEGLQEIVFTIDPSSYPYDNLIEYSKSYPKVKIHINDRTLMVFRNKIKAVSMCNSPWVILLDSDNVIDRNYLNIALSTNKQDNIIYQPSKALPHLDYSSLNGMVITKENIKSLITDRTVEMAFNTCNYILNRGEWLEAVNSFDGIKDPTGSDTAQINYLCLKKGMSLCIVKDLEYQHAVHDGSTYVKYSKEAIVEMEMLKKEIMSS